MNEFFFFPGPKEDTRHPGPGCTWSNWSYGTTWSTGNKGDNRDTGPKGPQGAAGLQEMMVGYGRLERSTMYVYFVHNCLHRS